MSRSPLARLLEHASHHRRRVALASACSITNKVFDLAPPILIGAAIDVVVAQEESFLAGLGVTDVMSQLWILALATVVVWALESVFEYAFAVLWRNLAQTVEHELRMEAWGHIQSLEMAYFEDESTGGLLALLNDDVNQLERFLDVGANQLLQVGTTVVVVGAMFFAAEWRLALIAFLPVPFVLWGSFRFQSRIAPRYMVVREKVSDLSALLANSLGGIATTKSFTAEERETARLNAASEAYREANREAIKLSSAFVPLIRMVIVVGFTATLVYGGHLATTGALNVGVYSILVFLTQRLLWPLTRLGETLDLLQRAMASTERILTLLAVKPTIEGGTVALGQPIEGALEFRDVTFQYPSAPTPTLSSLSIAIGAGETVAIVGSTGSGKSTLVKLLLRFYEYGEGAITFDGQDIRTVDLASLRRSIGVVSQDVFLFHGTVKDNVAFGRPDATDEEVWDALRAAEAEGFVRGLAHGLETVVGERGQKLSGGQRQRLSIARAVLKDPPILILDEATSAVDNETEAAIQRSMTTLSQDRTALVIAHRLSTVRDADRIYVLDAGRVSAVGTHDELVSAGGVYARMWSVQTGEPA
ncbi:MAG: ATP-binding cassette subfamily B protein [Bradymonadia bacterium]|jgi:ATP-binding cassette subfamily B protein